MNAAIAVSPSLLAPNAELTMMAMTTATTPTSRPSMIAAPARRHQPAGSPGGPGVELTGGRQSAAVSTDGAMGGCQSTAALRSPGAMGAPNASVSSGTPTAYAGERSRRCVQTLGAGNTLSCSGSLGTVLSSQRRAEHSFHS